MKTGQWFRTWVFALDQPLYVKALALQADQASEGPPFVLITADIIGFPRSLTEKIADGLKERFQIPRENVLAIGSHTHTGPVLRDRLEGMYGLEGKNLETVNAYTDQLPGRALEAVDAALKSMKPAQLSLGRGNATFAMNRRVFRRGGVTFGANPDGPANHEVSVLRLDNLDGSLRAVVFGYCCHCTTLRGDYYRINGDWAGYAQDFLERAHPGAMAFFATGCGADADPQPNGTLDLARDHGLEMAGAVSQALTGPRVPITGSLRAVFERVDVPFDKLPTREEFQEKLKNPDPYVRRHAQRQLDTLDREGKLPTSYPFPIQVWQFGKDLTLVALGGEVVVDYALRLKRELGGSGNLWVAGYANDVFAYIPSVRILLEGGYEADYAMVYYGLPTRFSKSLEDILIKKVHELVNRVRP